MAMMAATASSSSKLNAPARAGQTGIPDTGSGRGKGRFLEI
jgi:hypothetical protein